MGVTLIVVVIAQEAGDPESVAFERAARAVLGREAKLLIEHSPSDPPDEESSARSRRADGVVELSWSADRTHARIHGFLSRKQRWVDREVTFGASGESAESEAKERGRLLGFAVATMFDDSEALSEPADPPSQPTRPPAPPPTSAVAPAVTSRDEAPTRLPVVRHSSLEFAGIVSSGFEGTASGLGASAAIRVGWHAPFSVRAFLAGRAGNIPKAQASARTVQFGAGMSLRFLPESSRWELGARADGIVSYFEASHLSEDDEFPDRRTRWLVGSDLLAEGGFRFTESVGVYGAAGLEAMFGATQIYTHGRQVAVVPALRSVAELGIRTRF